MCELQQMAAVCVCVFEGVSECVYVLEIITKSKFNQMLLICSLRVHHLKVY